MGHVGTQRYTERNTEGNVEIRKDKEHRVTQSSTEIHREEKKIKAFFDISVRISCYGIRYWIII